MKRHHVFFPLGSVMIRDEQMIHVYAVFPETDEGVAWAVTGRVVSWHVAGTR